MYSKIVILSALMALVSAQYSHHSYEEEHHAPAHYEFKYGVEDPHTGDKKHHHESREGDHTQGEYSLVEPDGTVRTVKYTVDKHSGFLAEVHRSGHSQHAVPVHHAPVAIHHAPVSVHHAPVAVHHVPVAVHHAPHGHASSYSSISIHHNQHH